MTITLEGPAWAPHQLDVYAGRFPLSVEAHLMNMTARLVPGATTVTINARYYGLHGLVAAEAERRDLDAAAAYTLLRRCEVVVAGASAVHPDRWNAAHGHDRVKPQLERDGALDVAHLSVPGQYVKSQWGFLGPYFGSELTLGILTGNSFVPGPRVETEVLGNGFPDLFELAERDEVTLSELQARPELAISAARTSPDGAWLARLLCGSGVREPGKLDQTRRGTVRLLARAATVASGPSITESFRSLVAYGPSLREDAVTAAIPEAQAWRGLLFRHDSVGAWRKLWAWLVREIDGLTPPSALVAVTVESLPGGTLRQFLAELPDTVDAAGDPATAEEQVRAQGRSVPSESLGLLALGARRTRELEGNTRSALVGDERRPPVLSPLWMDRWLHDRLDRTMSDVASELVTTLLERAQRIAMGKMRIGKEGRIWLPTRVHERGGLLYKIGDEGSGNVGLRLSQLAGLLAAVGVFDRTPTWSVTGVGEELLGVGRS